MCIWCYLPLAIGLSQLCRAATLDEYPEGM
jgi:hypothetical protein